MLPQSTLLRLVRVSAASPHQGCASSGGASLPPCPSLHSLLIAMLLCALTIVTVRPTQAQQIDSFNDGDFTSNPTWNGDTGAWTIVDDATSGPDATDSNTLRLYEADPTGSIDPPGLFLAV